MAVIRPLMESDTVREWPARTDQVGGSFGLITRERAVLSRWVELSSMERADWRMGSWAAQPYRKTNEDTIMNRRHYFNILFFCSQDECWSNNRYMSMIMTNTVVHTTIPRCWFGQERWQTLGWRQMLSGFPQLRLVGPWRLCICFCSPLRNPHLKPTKGEMSPINGPISITIDIKIIPIYAGHAS